MPNAKNRQATNIVPQGATLRGTLLAINPSNYGFATCGTIAFGEQQSLFVYLEDSAKWTKGSEIVFVVGENEKGPAGIDPQPA